MCSGAGPSSPSKSASRRSPHEKAAPARPPGDGRPAPLPPRRHAPEMGAADEGGFPARQVRRRLGLERRRPGPGAQGGEDRLADRGVLPLGPPGRRRRDLPRHGPRRQGLPDRERRQGRGLVPGPGDGRDLPRPGQEGGALRGDLAERQDLPDHRAGQGRNVLRPGREIHLGPRLHGFRPALGRRRRDGRHLRDQPPGRGTDDLQGRGEPRPLPEEDRPGRRPGRERRQRRRLPDLGRRPGLGRLRDGLRGGPQPGRRPRRRRSTPPPRARRPGPARTS